MKTYKTMNIGTGEMMEVQSQAIKDLEPRCYIVKLNLGPSQVIQRDFCEEHYKEFLEKKS